MSGPKKNWFRRRPTTGEQAETWLVRRDRGLTASEQDDYLEWLRVDERNADAIAQAEATLRRVLQLGAWRAELSAEPNPDLLARPRGRKWRQWSAALAAAAAVAVAAGWWIERATPTASVVTKKNYLRVNERRVLPDGSRAELKDGTALEVHYSANERRVRLTGGEAQFSVMKDPARPFVVEAGGVAVRAVGTVFNVRLGSAAVDVLVTEGKVRVGLAAQTPGQIFQSRAADEEPPTVAAGQRAIFSLAGPALVPVVAEVTSDEIRRDLAWQAPRLQFDETPLNEAIAEFNQRNHRQLVLGDSSLGALPIGGTFRPDNVDGFVRLLAVTLGVRAESRGADELILRREK